MTACAETKLKFADCQLRRELKGGKRTWVPGGPGKPVCFAVELIDRLASKTVLSREKFSIGPIPNNALLLLRWILLRGLFHHIRKVILNLHRIGILFHCDRPPDKRMFLRIAQVDDQRSFCIGYAHDSRP